MPVTVWHGGKDNSVLPVMGKRIAAAIPSAQLHFLPEESHLFFLSGWREILGELLARGQTTDAGAIAHEVAATCQAVC